jgi:hypothetical protein
MVAVIAELYDCVISRGADLLVCVACVFKGCACVVPVYYDFVRVFNDCQNILLPE